MSTSSVRTGRSFSAILASAALLATAVVLPSAPADAAECDTVTYASTSQDWASISDGDNDCTYISVRHRYRPYPGSPYYWTNTEGGGGTYYRSDYAPELAYGDYTAY